MELGENLAILIEFPLVAIGAFRHFEAMVCNAQSSRLGPLWPEYRREDQGESVCVQESGTLERLYAVTVRSDSVLRWLVRCGVPAFGQLGLSDIWRRQHLLL